MKEIVEKYFENFNNHDITGLSELYSDDIVLKDWLTTLVGKDKVLSGNSDAFSTLEHISISVKNIYESDSGVACEIDISIVNEKESILLHVIDVLTINKEGKISEIRAYVLNP